MITIRNAINDTRLRHGHLAQICNGDHNTTSTSRQQKKWYYELEYSSDGNIFRNFGCNMKILKRNVIRVGYLGLEYYNQFISSNILSKNH